MLDFVVIGAGVYGTATAWWLAQAGASVCVVDERGVATRASGGPGRRGVRANGRDVRELALMPRAYEMWPNLHERLGSRPFYERTGQLLLAESSLDLERSRARHWMQNKRSIATQFLSADAVRELEPGISKSIRGALYCPNDGVADHAATTHAFATAAQAAGVEFNLACRIASIETHHGRASAVVTSGGDRIAAKRGIYVLTNSSVSALLKPWIELPVWNECLQVLISAPLDTPPFRYLTGHLSRVVSLKTQGEDSVMISGGWHGRWDENVAQGFAVDEAIADNVDEAIAVYPALRGMQVATADANHLESFCVDQIPIVDCVEGVDNLWYATGWCGHGWAIAPVVSELLAQWALERKPHALLRPFSRARFTQT